MSASALAKKIGFWSATSIIIGSIIGSGVFMKPSTMAQQLGSPVWLTLVWVIAGIFSLFGALVYAELGAMMPQSGGIYVYFRRMFGDFVAYLYGWSEFSVINTAAVAAIAFVCADYANYFLHLPVFTDEAVKANAWHIPFIGDLYPLPRAPLARRFGDQPLTRLDQALGTIVEPIERIRATVIGASQFTVQVSGKTIYLPDTSVLPVHNVPVVHLGLDIPDLIDIDEIADAFRKNAGLLDLDAGACLALAFEWNGTPEHARLFAMAKAIAQFAAPSGKRQNTLFLMIDGDVGASLGRILHKELHLDSKIVSIDGIKLRELDFVDVGELLEPQGVVPIVIKSLLFS